MNPFEGVEVIAFELSNRCVYSAQHERCPVDAKADLVVLPTQVISDVFDVMAEYEYDKIVQFSIYNEPLHDPRLYFLIDMVLRDCPGVFVDLLTNGWYLNQQILTELEELGVGSVRVTAYGDSEIERLTQLKTDKMVYGVGKGNLDDRIYTYERDYTGNNNPCIMPEKYIMINSDCSVGLCCIDFKHQHTWGNLLVTPLEEILTSAYRAEKVQDLKKGIRKLDLCKRCHHNGKQYNYRPIEPVG